MIVTVTAHPALDRSLTLAEPLEIGEVQTASAERVDPAGKGVNVARVVAAARQDVRAVVPLDPNDPYAVALAATGLEIVPVAVTGSARTNLTIADGSGTTTKINLPGVRLSAPETEMLVSTCVRAAVGARWLVLAGSLPPGAPDDLYARIITRMRTADSTVRVAVDTSGAALDAVVAHGGADLIKPNDDELAALTGRSLRDVSPERIVAVARDIVPRRVRAALITLGSRGAVLVDADGAWFAEAPRVTARSTVGAGDSSLAGYLLADLDGADAPDRLVSAIRHGAAAATLPGTQPPTAGDLPPNDIGVRPIVI